MKARAENRETAKSESEFDAFASSYDNALQQGLALSGETPDFFAEKRVSWTQHSLTSLGVTPKFIMDFGCGVGATTPILHRAFPGAEVTGVDTSKQSLEVAKARVDKNQSTFQLWQDYVPSRQIELAYTNGVFHHIPPAERSAVVKKLKESLRPRGLISFWENNPWNPGTRLVMSRIPFDRDAQTLTYLESRELLRSAGLEIVEVSFHFIFPKSLGALRFLERPLRSLPLGAQYHILCRNP